MAHPFAKMFTAALRKSTLEENLVLKEAEKLREKGYSPQEIYRVLQSCGAGLIDDMESEIVADAVEEFGEYVDE